MESRSLKVSIPPVPSQQLELLWQIVGCTVEVNVITCPGVAVPRLISETAAAHVPPTSSNFSTFSTIFSEAVPPVLKALAKSASKVNSNSGLLAPSRI